MKLYTSTSPDPFSSLCLITAKLAKQEVAQEALDIQKIRSDEFKEICPVQRVPYLKLADGKGLFESAAIARYLARLSPDSGLLGSTMLESAQVDQWLTLSSQAYASIRECNE